MAAHMHDNGEGPITVRDEMGHAIFTATQKHDRRSDECLHRTRYNYDFESAPLS
ncbi:hypothetical protein EC836_104391 [Erwinia sp. JUb26]|nr:hypothetical protein EC836_104391 [Erwinia sp. JUb26]